MRLDLRSGGLRLGPAVLALLLGLAVPDAPARAGLRTRALPELAGTVEPGLRARAIASGEDRIHAVVRVPRGDRRSAEADGTRLLRSIDGDVWLASIPADGLRAGRAPRGVAAAWDLRPEDRRHATVSRRAAEAEASPSRRDAEVALRLKVFADASIDDVAAAVRAVDGAIDGRAPRLGVLDVRVSAAAIATLSALDAVRWIEPAPPVPSSANNGLRVDAHVNPPQTLGIVGAGVLLGMWDQGMPDPLHPDLSGRVAAGEPFLPLAVHSTHVAGIALGDGTNSINEGGGGLQWRGVATGASLVAWDVPDHLAEVDSAINLHGIDLSTNSWRYTPDSSSCELFGEYSSDAPEYDAIVRGAYGRAIPVVFAAGNERDDGVCGIDTTGGYHSMAPPGTAKNVITVGANQSDLGYMTPFSNWGPTDDGRMKPDLTAPGCQTSGDLGITAPSIGVTSGVYLSMCGTSQAAPAVSGTVAMLLQEWWARFPGDPRPATSKALLGGYAQDRANPGPDYRFGLGALNADASVVALQTATTIEDAVADLQTDTWTFTVPVAAETLVVTLVWDDPPAAEIADTTLVNDLDLELVGPTSGTRLPFVLDPANPSADATTGVNRLDNVEQVRVLAPEAGTWTARVIGTSVPDGPQDYSLVGFDARPPADPASLTAAAVDDTTVDLTWIRPGDADRAGTLLVRSTSPVTWLPVEGVAYSPGTEPTPGVVVVAADDLDHSASALADDALDPGTLYHYAAFSYDEVPNYSPGVGDTATTTSFAVPAPLVAVGPAEVRFFRTGANPFRERTTFRFELPATGVVALDVYDARGRLVAGILRGERKAGSHAVAWDGRDASGRRAGAGVYFVRFRGPGLVRSEKVLLLR